MNCFIFVKCHLPFITLDLWIMSYIVNKTLTKFKPIQLKIERFYRSMFIIQRYQKVWHCDFLILLFFMAFHHSLNLASPLFVITYNICYSVPYPTQAVIWLYPFYFTGVRTSRWATGFIVNIIDNTYRPPKQRTMHNLNTKIISKDKINECNIFNIIQYCATVFLYLSCSSVGVWTKYLLEIILKILLIVLGTLFVLENLLYKASILLISIGFNIKVARVYTKIYALLFYYGIFVYLRLNGHSSKTKTDFSWLLVDIGFVGKLSSKIKNNFIRGLWRRRRSAKFIFGLNITIQMC